MAGPTIRMPMSELGQEAPPQKLERLSADHRTGPHVALGALALV